MPYLAIGAALLSAGLGYYNQEQTASRQDRTLANSLRQQYALQHQEDAKTRQLIQQTAQSTPDAAKSDLLGKFMAQIQANGGNTTRPLGQAGAVSDAYTKAANDASLGLSNYGSTNAGLVASIDAPAVQRQAEAANLSRYGSQLNDLKRQSSVQDYLTRLRLQGIRPNPWLSAVSDGLRAYGLSKAGSYKAGDGTGPSAWSQGNTISGSGGLTYNLPNTLEG
ncbi:hypothetical protein ACO2Q2_13355 [Dyella sp. KRB-257]|uniref:hypothetical protein n=1 Tax=Dyella sp. KRB-257 TaxID=3400915 RepID=UPI003C02E67D